MIRARILVVEDDQLIAEDLRLRLTSLGHEVVAVAGSGEDAVTAAGVLRPDLVFMDVRLGGRMDGVEAGRWIAASVGSAIVYVTATPDPNRMPYCVPKPFSTAALASAIAAVLG